jgi:hypothetical protein
MGLAVPTRESAHRVALGADTLCMTGDAVQHQHTSSSRCPCHCVQGLRHKSMTWAFPQLSHHESRPRFNTHQTSSLSCTLAAVRRVRQGVLRAHGGRGRHPRRHACGAGRAAAQRAVRDALPPAEPVRGCGPRRLAGRFERHRCNTPGQLVHPTQYTGASAKPEPQHLHFQIPDVSTYGCQLFYSPCRFLRMRQDARRTSSSLKRH